MTDASKVSNDRSKAIQDKLTEKEFSFSCIICGQINFAIADKDISLLTRSPAGGYDTVGFACSNCGYFYIFHKDILMDKKP